MKMFVVSTSSESGDYYLYIIKHPTKPTNYELELWLSKEASDKDNEVCYESIRDVIEVNENTITLIPKKGKVLEFL